MPTPSQLFNTAKTLASGGASAAANAAPSLSTRLNNLNILARGGEAAVYRDGSKVLKVYNTSPRQKGLDLNPYTWYRQGRSPNRFKAERQHFDAVGARDPMNAERMGVRNLVPGMPQAKFIGHASGHGNVFEQAHIAGQKATWRDIFNWAKQNNVQLARKTKGVNGWGAIYGKGATAMQNIGTGSLLDARMALAGLGPRTPEKLRKIVRPALGGVVKVRDGNHLGFIPRYRHLIMDDIRPDNFIRSNSGNVVPIDVIAAKLPYWKALGNLPEVQRQFARNSAIAGGAGLAGYGGYTGLTRGDRSTPKPYEVGGLAQVDLPASLASMRQWFQR